MSLPYIVKIPSFSIPWSNSYLGKYRLNSFQHSLHKLLEEKNDLVLEAPTGSGKTLSLLLSPGFTGESTNGFVALYPNNTLLRNQIETIISIIREALGGKEVYPESKICGDEDYDCIEPLRIYQLSEEILGAQDSWCGDKYVALFALSSKSIISEDGTPKREILYNYARKILRKRKEGIYTIVFSTPDTFLLIFTGAYMSFENVGKALHNILLAIAEGKDPEKIEDILRKTGVMTRQQESAQRAVVEHILRHPLFIDEFHLYGPYELDALYSILSIFKHWHGLPVILSSATPAQDTIQGLLDTGLKPTSITADISSIGFPVKGSTKLMVIPVTTSKKGLGAYYEASEHIITYVPEKLLGLLKEYNDSKDERALLILEKLWMVQQLKETLINKGFKVECMARLVPKNDCTPGAPIIVGSESTTQGVNLGKVTLGITGGVSGEDVIQRIGRIGRKGLDSTIILFIPENSLDENPIPPKLTYPELVSWILQTYPNYTKRSRDTSRFLPAHIRKTRRNLIKALTIASMSRVTGVRPLLNLIDLSPKDAIELLNNVIGPPTLISKLIMFRKTGFRTKYIDNITMKKKEESIGLITRNFNIIDVLGDTLIIEFTKSRSRLRLKVNNNPKLLDGKLLPISYIIEFLKGTFTIETPTDELVLEVSNPENLAYVISTRKELSEYLSYTGEGVQIVYNADKSYALIFV